jgi:hypothetical protein
LLYHETRQIMLEIGKDRIEDLFEITAGISIATNPSYTFTGLKSKEKYWFQVVAIGLNGQETASPPVARVVQ